jgi:hypothetical protein
MRKKKENIKLSQDPDVIMTPALETQREERYELASGDHATEGVGSGYTNEPRFEETIQSGDGPLAGETTDPPVLRSEVLGTRKRRRHKKRTIGRHAAARSTKSI